MGFEKYGKIGDVFIPKDKFTRESRGFAFVRFYDKRDAEDAMDALDGRMYDGRDLRIQMAKYGRPDINRFDSGRRGGRSRSRSRGRRGRSRSRSGSRGGRRGRRSPSRRTRQEENEGGIKEQVE